MKRSLTNGQKDVLKQQVFTNIASVFKLDELKQNHTFMAVLSFPTWVASCITYTVDGITTFACIVTTIDTVLSKETKRTRLKQK